MSATDKKISLTKATTWTGNWRATPTTAARAFLVPVEDLQGVLNEISGQGGTPQARAYLAIDDTGVEKLIFVGTTPETQRDGTVIYRDLLPSATEDYETAANAIYDFTLPIPPEANADDSSPLN